MFFVYGHQECWEQGCPGAAELVSCDCFVIHEETLAVFLCPFLAHASLEPILEGLDMTCIASDARTRESWLPKLSVINKHKFHQRPRNLQEHLTLSATVKHVKDNEMPVYVPRKMPPSSHNFNCATGQLNKIRHVQGSCNGTQQPSDTLLARCLRSHSPPGDHECQM
jgi:hypothetical protein